MIATSALTPIAAPAATPVVTRLLSSLVAPLVRRPGVGRSRWHHGSITALAPDLTALLDRVRHGDESAFAQLYDALASTVYGVVRRVLRDPAMSEEVTQEVFVELWRTAPRFDDTRASATGWATTIARRRAIDRIRREQSQRDRTAVLAAQRADEPDGVEDATVGTIERERVRLALETLPPEQREVIELAFLDGRPHGEIATMLDLPLGTVKGRIRLGLVRLRGRLSGDPDA
jgi:RNA polymerase sigma-70 factor (ECF subfamily)